jgi:predicted ABC-type ATPase
MMTQAKQKGWQVNLIYVGVNDVQTNIKRVAQRVAQGGHNVPTSDLRRRYTRSLANLATTIQKADQTIIYDNSTAAGYQPIITIEAGRVTKFIDELPEWIKSSLPPELIA